MKPIRLAVIADDITGASDCGGQLIHYGLNVSVILNNNSISEGNKEAIIYNTDSRSVPENEAYAKNQELIWQMSLSYNISPLDAALSSVKELAPDLGSLENDDTRQYLILQNPSNQHP